MIEPLRPLVDHKILIFALGHIFTLACDQKKDSANRSDGQNQTAPDAASGTDTDTGTGNDAARQDAIDVLSNKTYEDVKGTSDCTDDCSGHNAGFEWAKEHEVFDPEKCTGDSNSFIEGCKAYGEEIESRTNDTGAGSSPSN